MMKELMKLVKEMMLMVLLSCVILAVFALAALQESYRLNPPSAEELAECPAIVRVLIGR